MEFIFAEKRIGLQLQLASEKGMVFADIQQIVDVLRRNLLGISHNPLYYMVTYGQLTVLSLKILKVCYMTPHVIGVIGSDIAMLPLYQDLPIQIIDGYQSVWPLPNGFR